MDDVPPRLDSAASLAGAGSGPTPPVGSPPPGHVWLVGAGPGDPGLFTVRGRELLAEADVVVTDRLAAGVLLEWARPEAEVVHVGKSPGSRSRSQDEVNALLVEHALAGRSVVRLKGGDPFLLGRGGEEAAACAAAGVGCTVVPGVPSAIAVPAYAGIPVTHRELAQDVMIISGHLPPGHPDSTVDWLAVGASSATVVILMGVARLMGVTEALLAGGRPPETPAAVIERGSTPAQRVLRTTLEALAVDAIAAGVRSPAVVVVGAVAARNDAPAVAVSPRGRSAASSVDSRVADEGRVAAGVAVDSGGADSGGSARPLVGVRVLVPRTRDRQGLLAGHLRRLGADVVETVVSRLEPVSDHAPLLAALPGADALVLADADEVAALVTLLRQAGGDVRTLAGLTLVALGDDAADALDALGLTFVRSTTDIQVADLVVTDVATPNLQVVVCASAPPPVGARTVRRVRLVRDAPVAPDPRVVEELRHADVDVVAFASSTAARITAQLYHPFPSTTLVVAMGRRTVAACREAGLHVDAVASHPGIYGLADAVATAVDAARGGGGGGRAAATGLAERPGVTWSDPGTWRGDYER